MGLLWKPTLLVPLISLGCHSSQGGRGASEVVIDSQSTVQATYGMPLELPIDATGGTPPYHFSVEDPQNLPQGLRIDAQSGEITGAPERMGDFRFRVRVEDNSVLPHRKDRIISLQVGPPVFSTRGRQILLNGSPFFLKGIDYGPFIAGDSPFTKKVKNTDPFEDMREIKEVLHANVIRVYESLPQEVYDAARQNGLFVIQGIHLQVDGPEPSDHPECLETKLDLLKPALFRKLKNHVVSELRTIHQLGASDLILSYVVGNEINFCVQRSTILKHQDRPRYKGTFYHVPEQTKLPDLDGYDGCESSIDHFWDPHPFQSFLAELADGGALFEAETFGERHLWGHATDPNMSIALGRKDEFFPEIHFPADTSFLDIVFENVYSYFPPAVRFLGYREYLEKVAQAYPNTPFVVLECGYSTSPTRGSSECASGPVCGQPKEEKPTSFCFGGNTQLEQAEGFQERWQEVTLSPVLVAGFFVFEYYDEWWKGSERSQFVQDIDKPEEWFGIKGVHGSPKNFKVTKKLAFQTVSQMFDQEVVGPALQKFDAAADKLKAFSPPDATHSPLQGPELRD